MKMMVSVTNLAVAAGALLLALGLGNVILDLVGLRKPAGRERLAFAGAIGIIALGLGTLALGHAGLLYAWIFRIAAAVGLVLTVPALVRLSSQLGGDNLITKFLECSLFEKVLIVLIAAQVSTMLLVSLAPPVGADALAYHLAVPKIYISDHAIINLQNHKHAAQPFLIEMIFLFGMLLKSDTVAQLLNFAITCAAGGSVYLLAHRLFSRRAGIIAVAAFMLTPQLMGSVELMGPESGMAFLVTLTFLALVHWTQAVTDRPAKTPWLVIIALLSAGVAGMKQSGVGHVLLIAPAALLIPSIVFRERLSTALRRAAVYGAITLVLGGGWYLRSYAMTGNPIHPYGSRAPFAGKETGRSGMGKTLGSLLVYPWNITMNGRRFGMLVTDNPGPLPLAFVPLLLLVLGPVPRAVKFMLLYVAAFSCAVFYTSQLTRYLIPVFGFTSIAAAVAIERMERLGRAPALAAAAAVIVACVMQIGLSARAAGACDMERLTVVVGNAQRSQFLSKASYSYDAFQFLNCSAPPQSRVMLLYGHEAYYLDQPYLIAGFTMAGSPLTRQDYKSKEAFLAAVKRLNVDYVYVDEYVRDLFYKHRIAQNPHVAATQEWFLNGFCRVVFQKGGPQGNKVKVYELKKDDQSLIPGAR